MIVMSSDRNENQPLSRHFNTVVVFPVSGGAEKRIAASFLARQAECNNAKPLRASMSRTRGSTTFTYRTALDSLSSQLTSTVTQFPGVIFTVAPKDPPCST